LSQAARLGILVIAAAGNKLFHQRDMRFYPAAYNLPNVLSVVATDRAGHVLPTSNLNLGKGNLFVLGQDIESTLPHNQFGMRTGSSQAAALFTGKIVSQLQKIKRTLRFGSSKQRAHLQSFFRFQSQKYKVQ
jgi:hypothetical protein